MNRRDFMKMGVYAALTAYLPKEAHAERVRQIQVYNPAGIDSIVEGMHFKVQTDRKEYILTLYNHIPPEPTLPDIMDRFELKEQEKELKDAFSDFITKRERYWQAKQESLGAFIKTMMEAGMTLYENQHCGLIGTANPLIGAACYATHIIIDAHVNGTYKMIIWDQETYRQSLAASRRFDALKGDYMKLVADLKKRLHHSSICRLAGIESEPPRKVRYDKPLGGERPEGRDRFKRWEDPGFISPKRPFEPPKESPKSSHEKPPKRGPQVEYRKRVTRTECIPRPERQPPVCKTETTEIIYKGTQEGLQDALKEAEKLKSGK